MDNALWGVLAKVACLHSQMLAFQGSDSKFGEKHLNLVFNSVQIIADRLINKTLCLNLGF